MLAGQLQRRGVSYRLLEARPAREYWCKALGVSPRTLEIFDQSGYLDAALAPRSSRACPTSTCSWARAEQQHAPSAR
jgi:2-polyprenyl-6-methoxyphenol hydroxylase-like FAD-dependent oxidoreductase